MITTAATSHDFNALLAEGRARLADREREYQAMREQAEADRRSAWADLVATARADFPALATYLPGPEEVPGHFTGTDTHTFTVAPWHAAAFSIAYYPPAHDQADWRLYGRFSVPERYELRNGDDDDEPWYVTHAGRFLNTEVLAEALALCEQRTEAYQRLQAQANAKNAELRSEKASGRAKQEVTPTPPTAEQRLLAALTELIREHR